MKVFLGAFRKYRPIRQVMIQKGYAPAVHEEGCQMLNALIGYKPPDFLFYSAGKTKQDEALRELDRWDGPHLASARAALERLHPD